MNTCANTLKKRGKRKNHERNKHTQCPRGRGGEEDSSVCRHVELSQNGDLHPPPKNLNSNPANSNNQTKKVKRQSKSRSFSAVAPRLLLLFFSSLFFSSPLLLFSSLRLPHLQSPYQPHCLSTIMDGVDQEVVNLENLPPITERLKDLRPSKVRTTHACTHIHAHSRVHAHAHSHVHSITHTLTHSLNHIIQELLEFYRQKLAEFDAEHTSMLAKLDKYKHGCDDKVRACFFETTSLVVADNPCAPTHKHTHTQHTCAHLHLRQ